MIVECTASALKIRSLPTLEDATDLGKRFMKGQTAEVYGKSMDGKFYYVDAPAARGWVSVEYVAESKVIITSPAWPRIPNGLNEIKALFGEPGKPICYAGRVRLKRELKISWGQEKIVVFACHKLVEDVMQSCFDQIHDQNLWDLLGEWGGCYNYRPVRGSSHISTHAWGIGIDLDPDNNPLGGVGKLDTRIIRVFKDHGFMWGGDFSGRKDPMHMQYAKGY